MLHFQDETFLWGVERASSDLCVALQRPLTRESTDQLYRKLTIGALPSDVLLDIFKFHLHLLPHPYYFLTFSDASPNLNAWHILIHVCRRWRHVVLGSPRSLDLRLLCTHKTPVRTMLDIWPACPIIVSCHRDSRYLPGPLHGVRNIIAALKCRDRVCEIHLLGVPRSLLKRFAALNVPFPELKSVQLSLAEDEWLSTVLPDSFLGGFAPRLRSLDLYSISFPEPQKLLSSTPDLVTLRLEDIPDSGYISPEEMVSCLSGLTKLEQVALGFRFPYPEYTRQQYPPLPSRTVLPALTSFRLQGDLNYLVALISRIGIPPLEDLDIKVFSFLPESNASVLLLLHEFINRIEAFETSHRADIAIENWSIQVTISRPEGMVNSWTLKVGVSCNGADEQFSHLVHLCKSLLPLSTVEDLHLHSSFPRDMDYSDLYVPEIFRWADVLLPFTSVKNLHISEELAMGVSDALQQSPTESVLPVLQNIFLPGSQPSGALLQASKQLAANRRLSGRPVSVNYQRDLGYRHQNFFEVV
jgi:hypothetical protein